MVEHYLYFYGHILFLYVPTFERKMPLEGQLCQARLLGISRGEFYQSSS
jgi:hypothetical protein